MFAVIKTGGKQYLVSEGDKISVEKLDYKIGQEFDFPDVLLFGPSRQNGAEADNEKPENVKIGAPLVSGVKVTAKVLDHGKADKKIIFKYSNKTRYKRKKGHRQPFTKIEILKISL